MEHQDDIPNFSGVNLSSSKENEPPQRSTPTKHSTMEDTSSDTTYHDASGYNKSGSPFGASLSRQHDRHSSRLDSPSTSGGYTNAPTAFQDEGLGTKPSPSRWDAMKEWRDQQKALSHKQHSSPRIFSPRRENSREMRRPHGVQELIHAQRRPSATITERPAPTGPPEFDIPNTIVREWLKAHDATFRELDHWREKVCKNTPFYLQAQRLTTFPSPNVGVEQSRRRRTLQATA